MKVDSDGVEALECLERRIERAQAIARLCADSGANDHDAKLALYGVADMIEEVGEYLHNIIKVQRA